MCGYSGQKHKFGREFCPAWGETCNSCRRRNHFAKQCRQGRRDNTNQVKEPDSNSDSEYIDSTTVKPEKKRSIGQQQSTEIYAKMLVRGQPIRFHVDCGAIVNVLPIKYLTGEKMIPTDRTSQMWNKTELKPKGTCCLTIRNPKNDKKYSVEFMAVQENLTPLLGARAIQRMGIVEIHNENFEQAKQRATKKTHVTNQQPIRAKRAIQTIEDFRMLDGELGML